MTHFSFSQCQLIIWQSEWHREFPVPSTQLALIAPDFSFSNEIIKFICTELPLLIISAYNSQFHQKIFIDWNYLWEIANLILTTREIINIAEVFWKINIFEPLKLFPLLRNLENNSISFSCGTIIPTSSCYLFNLLYDPVSTLNVGRDEA